jgi:elongation factor G
METFAVERLRNVALVSHSGAGKTSLGEALLFTSGAISRMGRTEDGNTTADYDLEAIKRRSSTQLALLPCLWQQHKVTLLDTPGYSDLLGEALSALRVADAAILVVAADAKMEVGTEQMWRRLREQRLPTLIFVNKLDRENTDFSQIVDLLQRALGKECVALQVPQGSGQGFSGVINLLAAPAAAPAGLQAQFDAARDRLAEAVAETDEALATKYLEGEALSDQVITAALKQAVAQRKLVPVLVGSATKNLGTRELLDAILALLPSPADAPLSQAVGANRGSQALKLDPTGPRAVLVFKTVAEQHAGKLSLLRVYSGTLQSNSEVYNVNRQQAERIGQLLVPRGKSQETVASLGPGEIGAVARLTVTRTGDTLGQKEQPLELPGIAFPTPFFSMAVFPKTSADLDKLSIGLNRVTEEDPTLRFTREPQTGEPLLTGYGDVHVDLAVQRAQRKFGVNLVLQTPRVPYKETISQTAQVEHRYKQQSGGHGHFAHIFLRVEPRGQGQGLEFASEVVGGNVPKEFIPAVEKGVRRACAEGVLTGFPVVDTKAVIYDGSHHPVDSATMDFDICGYFAFKKAFTEASPGLLEPIMLVRVTTPDDHTGDVIGDMNSKRGRILGMQPQGDGTSVLEAHIPLAELQRYAPGLRSLTQGRATFTMEFDHDEELPAHLAQQVIQKAQQQKEAAKA